MHGGLILSTPSRGSDGPYRLPEPEYMDMNGDSEVAAKLLTGSPFVEWKTDPGRRRVVYSDIFAGQ